MTATSKKAAWDEVNKIFPTDYERSAAESERAGYAIFRSTAEAVNAWISDLGDRLEINLPDGKTVNIWIEEPKEQSEDNMAARIEVLKRVQRLTYYYTEEYVKELDNKKREDAAVKELEEAKKAGDGEIRCMVLTAEHNAKVLMGCITDCITAVNTLKNRDKDVEDWMIAGINAMMDKVNGTGTIPYDLPLSICGLLCVQYQ